MAEFWQSLKILSLISELQHFASFLNISVNNSLHNEYAPSSPWKCPLFFSRGSSLKSTVMRKVELKTFLQVFDVYLASVVVSLVSGSGGFVANILQIGIALFLLKSFKDPWTLTSCKRTRSSISRFVKSISIFCGMCSVGHRYFRVILIFCR